MSLNDLLLVDCYIPCALYYFSTVHKGMAMPTYTEERRMVRAAAL